MVVKGFSIGFGTACSLRPVRKGPKIIITNRNDSVTNMKLFLDGLERSSNAFAIV